MICADEDPETAITVCALRKGDTPLGAVLLLVSGLQLTELELREDLFDDFCTYAGTLMSSARLRALFTVLRRSSARIPRSSRTRRCR